MRRLVGTLAILLVGAIGAGCGTAADQAQKVSLAALGLPAATPTQTSTASTRCTDNSTASLRPPAAMPAPGAMPAGSDMAAIKRRGYLIAGVDQNTLLFAYFNPRDDQIEGFEIDLLRSLARAIFGDANPARLHLKVITTGERVSAVQNGSVDIVADAMTITCQRKRQVDFSTVYYNATQRLLVPLNRPVPTLNALRGLRVCATRGSTSISNIGKYLPGAIPYPVEQRTDCLVALQEGLTDAVTSDDAILLGFQAQDPATKIAGPPISPQPYGLAMSKSHPDFVRFVNGWLDEIRHDGTWQAIYRRWLGGLSATPTPPPATYVGS